MAKSNAVKLTAGDRLFYFGINAFLIFIGLIIAIPMIATITQSVTPNGYRGTAMEKFILRPVGLKDHSFKDVDLADGEYVFTVENYGDLNVSVVDGEGTTISDIELSLQHKPYKNTTKTVDVFYDAKDQNGNSYKIGIREGPTEAKLVKIEKVGIIWDGSAYKALVQNNGFIIAFWNSLKIMVFGVITSLCLTVPMAYCMSVSSLPGRKFLNYFVLIPYLFHIGLIPTFLVVKNLGLIDHHAAIFMPGAIGTYNCLIMRGFFEGIPESLKESARIDGASEWYVLVSIILPLSKPIIMTIGLYYAVNFWNDFMHAMLYLNKANLQPLPILLRNILMGIGMNENVETNAWGSASVQAVKAASVFLSAIPMMLAYPFIQKYFTKGTMLGSVKG